MKLLLMILGLIAVPPGVEAQGCLLPPCGGGGGGPGTIPPVSQRRVFINTFDEGVRQFRIGWTANVYALRYKVQWTQDPEWSPRSISEEIVGSRILDLTVRNIKGGRYFLRVNGVSQWGEAKGHVQPIVVRPFNLFPKAFPDSVTVLANTSTMLDVLSNDTDSNGDELYIHSVTIGANGTVTLPDDSKMIQYDPAPGLEEGEEVLTYVVTDRWNGLDTTTVYVAIVLGKDWSEKAQLSVVSGVGTDDVNEALLPEISRAMTDITVGGIAGRVETAFQGLSHLQVGGARDPAGLMRSLGRFDAKRFLSSSSFSRAGRVSLWAEGGYRHLQSGREWDGELLGGQAGIDVRLRPNLILGASSSYAVSDFAYGPVQHDATLLSVNPYAAWQPWSGFSVLGIVGYGRGTVDLQESLYGESQPIEQLMGAVGTRGVLWFGPASVALRSELFYANMSASPEDAQQVSVDVHRIRVALDVGYTAEIGGIVLQPSVELGVRQDGGAGRTGSGIEAGGGLRVITGPLLLEGRGRKLVRSYRYDEWILRGSAAFDPGGAGGLLLRLGIDSERSLGLSGSVTR